MPRRVQADRVEEGLRGHSEGRAQTYAPLDRREIEPVVVKKFVRMSIRVHAITLSVAKQNASP